MTNQEPQRPQPTGNLKPYGDPPPVDRRRLVLVAIVVNIVTVTAMWVGFMAIRFLVRAAPVAGVAQTRGAAPAQDEAEPTGDVHDVCSAHYAALRHLFQKRQHVFAASHYQLLLEGGLVVKVINVYSTQAGSADFDSLARASLIAHDVKLVLPDPAAFRDQYVPESRSDAFVGEGASPAVVAGAHYGVVPVIADLSGSR